MSSLPKTVWLDTGFRPIWGRIWGCSSLVEGLPSTHNTLGWALNRRPARRSAPGIPALGRWEQEGQKFMVIPGYTLNLRPLGGEGRSSKKKKPLQSVGLYFTETKFKVWMMLRLCGGSGGKNKEGRLGPTSCQARRGGEVRKLFPRVKHSWEPWRWRVKQGYLWN